MYTVQELIEALQKCPKEYTITIFSRENGYERMYIDCIGIDTDDETVDLFIE